MPAPAGGRPPTGRDRGGGWGLAGDAECCKLTHREALQTLKYEFSRLILEDQECFRSERGWQTLLELLPADREVKDALRAEWEAQPDASSTARWEQLMAHMPRKGSPQYRKYKNAIEDVILQYTYPRIDAEVSKHRNHLLKSPFCVHPGTGE